MGSSSSKPKEQQPPIPTQSNSTPSFQPNCNPNANIYTQQNANGFGDFNLSQNANSGNGLKLVTFKDEKVNPEDEICSVIVTVNDNGSSYDQMFTQLPQKAPEGSRIVVYQSNFPTLVHILDYMKNKRFSKPRELSDELQARIKTLSGEIESCDADCVVFNWECCSCCSNTGFAKQRKETLELMKLILDRGNMVMCSDFSLKALIKDWKEEYFGPNPFTNIGEFGGSFKIHFDPKKLAECPSTQLQTVGELCEKGTADVHAMAGTIAYAINYANTDHSHYNMEVLTVATNQGPCKANTPSKINKISGNPAHVLLTYPSGGKILTSAGHWVELMKLDVSYENLLKVAEERYGSSYMSKMVDDIGASSGAVRQEKMKMWSKNVVMQSQPCQNMAVKRKKGW